MTDSEIRSALQQHWLASDADDFAAEHAIYADDAILEYPQSRERIRGRSNIQASRMAQPDRKRFTLKRIQGAGALWISQLQLTYDEKRFHVVSIMDFLDAQVARETQYFGEAFEAGSSRARWVETMQP
ncbi:nuclear transport factor 2 family protein [soil metagenome]